MAIPTKPHRPRHHGAAACVVVALALAPAAPVSARTAAEETDREPTAIELGDRAWLRRAEGHRGHRPAAAPIARAVASYREALAADPGALEASWKLLRALYFQGELAVEDRDAKAVFAVGRDGCVAAIDRLGAEVPAFAGVADSSADELRRLLGDRPGVARLFFWCSVHWGLWGESHGKLQAVRQGVATKVRDYAAAAAAVDPAAEDAGGYRVLGRLHAEAPKVPFFTGWISRDAAISNLRRAAEIAPHEPLNRLYLAEALLDFGPASERGPALAKIEELSRLEPRATHRVEDLYARQQARERLSEQRSP